jgi:hypothetical protein
MSMQREWKYHEFGHTEDVDGKQVRTTSHVIVDDRLKGKEKYHPQSGKLSGRWGLFKWTPLLVIQTSERVTPEDAVNYAKVICDALNADWVKKQLQGEE